jgi:hypothetical protein
VSLRFELLSFRSAQCVLCRRIQSCPPQSLVERNCVACCFWLVGDKWLTSAQYNVSAVAEAAAKAQHAASADPAQTTQTTDTVVVPVSTDPSAPASGPSAETSPEQKKNIKHQNRAQAAAKLAEAYKASASVPLEVGTKRKAEEMEAGEVPPEEQVEKGELVEVRPGEGVEVELEGFEEVVEGGRVLKFRKEE